MNTRRHLIKIISALPLVGLAATSGLLSACGKKETAVAPAAAPPAAPAAPPAPAAAAPPAPAAVATPEPAAPAAPAATTGLPLLDEKEPAAVALGYFNDATKTDKAKYPKYADGQNCANCALYQGAAGSAQGGCPLFAGKNVAAVAWCSAYAKKAA